LSAEDKAARSAAIIREVEKLPELVGAATIMAFAPLPDEADLKPLWKRIIASGRTVVFPVIVGGDGRMEAAPATDVERDLKPGRFGIAQPAEAPLVDPARIDFIFIPALAFDEAGNRVGRGGGYYDRFLATRAPRAFRCGVAFECQVLKSLPVKEHDCRVQILVTENGLRRFLGPCGLAK
jgi:5-formyltetrahydrofolate cyclo-ligase